MNVIMEYFCSDCNRKIGTDQGCEDVHVCPNCEAEVCFRCEEDHTCLR